MDVIIEGDLVICRQRSWTVETADEWLALCQEMRTRHGRAFAIMEVSQGLEIAVAARRRIAQGFRERQLALLVVVGASLPTRVLFTLVSRAIAILRNRPANLRFAATLDEALALINAKRNRQENSPRSGVPVTPS